ncbi:hypothetical protein [Candidatus Hodgkinia cicadicola]|uniref:hypothetical protein n=1 Tax=Candidatus Hodgkinia cicadicola TaxID=573658 RepID=UPI002414F3CC
MTKRSDNMSRLFLPYEHMNLTERVVITLVGFNEVNMKYMTNVCVVDILFDKLKNHRWLVVVSYNQMGLLNWLDIKTCGMEGVYYWKKGGLLAMVGRVCWFRIG